MQIDKGIPIPLTPEQTEANVLKALDVGDSVFFPWENEGDAERLRNRIMARARYARPKRFILRMWPADSAPNGFRVWRTS